MSARTPGPWRIAPVSDYVDGSLNIDGGLRGYVCMAGHRGDETAEANARLIAAAPTMLDALKTTAGNIRSLLAAASGDVREPYSVWLKVVEDAIQSAEKKS